MPHTDAHTHNRIKREAHTHTQADRREAQIERLIFDI